MTQTQRIIYLEPEKSEMALLGHCRCHPSRPLPPELLFQLLVTILCLMGALADTQHTSSGGLHFQTTHKMGTLALRRFQRIYFKDFDDLIIFGNRVQPHAEEPTVVVVRDMFDATVSGYLYHKTGRECWLDAGGKLNPFPKGGNDWLRRLNWTESVLKVPVPEDIRNLNLCQVLKFTDETIGIGIYLEFARNQFYRSVAELKSRTKDPTLFVCFDDLLSHKFQTERRIRSFIEQTLNATAARGVQLRRRLTYDGHSTDPDPELRARLRDIARDIDCIYFGCETKAWNDALRCTTAAVTETYKGKNRNKLVVQQNDNPQIVILPSIFSTWYFLLPAQWILLTLLLVIYFWRTRRLQR